MAARLERVGVYVWIFAVYLPLRTFSNACLLLGLLAFRVMAWTAPECFRETINRPDRVVAAAFAKRGDPR